MPVPVSGNERGVKPVRQTFGKTPAIHDGIGLDKIGEQEVFESIESS
nr:MAG TPA: hypothetical protein [Caudoviricetes sp.]